MSEGRAIGGRLRVAAIAAFPLLSGCVAAALIPVAASSSAIVKKRMDEKRTTRRAPTAKARQTGTVPLTTVTAPDGQSWTIVSGAKGLPPPSGIAATAPSAPSSAPAPTAAVPGAVPETMQYLYGSGEGAGSSIQAYRALSRYLADTIAYRRKGTMRQVVLSDGASLNAPRFEPCGPKPLAIVLDVDETAVLNLGFEADAAKRGGGYDDPRWQRWEATGAAHVVAVPGAKAALDAARELGITVIFNSNRTAANAAATEAALDHAGLGPAKHGSTLWLKGDDGGGSGKDDRRWAIASGYCVIAMVGDQLGDFSDLFNTPNLTPSTRRALAASPALAELWGNGWFLLPNPVYGTALKGGFDEIFPMDMRWTDPAEEKKR